MYPEPEFSSLRGSQAATVASVTDMGQVPDGLVDVCNGIGQTLIDEVIRPHGPEHALLMVHSLGVWLTREYPELEDWEWGQVVVHELPGYSIKIPLPPRD